MEFKKQVESAQELTIGVFDSGVGGLTVAREILQQLPGARLMYMGDTAHVPYGPRPLAQVRDFALQIIAFLFARGAEAVVMGCNMSAAAGTHEAATMRFTKPIFEVITPGSQAACAASDNGKIGVIATLGTVNSGVYPRTLSALGAQAVYQQACPAFVPLVERGIDSGSEVDAAVTEYLTPLCTAGVDTLIMGCTHYPYLRTAISNFLGTQVRLIDPGSYVAQDVARYFAARSSALRPNSDPRRHHFYSSGDPESLRREGERLLGIPLLSVEHVEVPDDASSGL